MTEPTSSTPGHEPPSRENASALASSARQTAAYLLRMRLQLPRSHSERAIAALPNDQVVTAFLVDELLDAAALLVREKAEASPGGGSEHGRVKRTLEELWDQVELDALERNRPAGDDPAGP